MQCKAEESGTCITVGAYVAALSQEAVESRSAHPEAARRAAQATTRRLRGELQGRDLDRDARKRLRDYYYAVLRNEAFRNRGRVNEVFRKRLKVASLVRDLRDAGVDDIRIHGEVEAFFGREALEYLTVATAVS